MTTLTSLSEWTTLEVGGAARELVRVDTIDQALFHYRKAREQGWPLLVLGGGSNMLVSDEGFPGLVLQWQDRSLERLDVSDSQVVYRVGGGWNWDDWVAYCVDHQLAGLECLSGIPGRVGAAPIQNIGAYGREVAECIEACWVLEWESGQVRRLPAEECGFGYRHSHFKGSWRGQYLVTSVEFRLQPSGRPLIRYAELQRALSGEGADLAEVRQAVLAIRRSKSMVWDPADPNHRSAGSFFVNPVVKAEQAEALRRQWGDSMPAYPAGQDSDGQDLYKLSAAWLIERSGFPKGYGSGPAGLSTRHVLALVNRGSARASDLLQLAATIRRGVRQQFCVELVPEPELVGFTQSVDQLLSNFD